MTPAAIVAALFALGKQIAESAQLSNDEIRVELAKKMDKESAVAEAFLWYESMLKNSSER